MLFHLFAPLADYNGFFNLFRYITFRTGGAIFFSFFLTWMIGPLVIRMLKARQKFGQPIRDDGPETHLIHKKGTPTMGGVMMLVSIFLSACLWCDLRTIFVWAVLFVMVGYGVIGAIDDSKKLRLFHSRGLSPMLKFSLQIFIGAVGLGLIFWGTDPRMAYGLSVPFLKTFIINHVFIYSLFAMIVIVGSSNAVNLTDGLDGLSIFPIITSAACFAFICYIVGHFGFASYLHVPFIHGAGEVAILCGAILGAGLGFLWFNAPPAQVFMGDTGSLALGGALGAISVITKHEFVFALVGGIFVVETLSVIIQVVYFRYSGGKRIFLMAPIHHHFEKKGWSEPTIVIRFWILSILLAICGLATLKIR